MKNETKVLVTVAGAVPRDKIEKLINSLVEDEKAFYADHYVGQPGGAVRVQFQK